MAQPAKDKTPFCINTFWEQPTQELRVKWKQHVTLAIISKNNADLEDLLLEKPTVWYTQTNRLRNQSTQTKLSSRGEIKNFGLLRC